MMLHILLFVLFQCGNASDLIENIQGKCGKDITWSFNAEINRLNITGNGEMYDRMEEWDDIRQFVKSIDLNSVTTINSYAFSYSGLTSIIIPSSVTSIGTYAFSDCIGLTTITLGDNVKTISTYAFNGCNKLKTVNLGSITTINSNAFTGCSSLTTITIPTSITTIDANAFTSSGLTKVIFNGSTEPSGCNDNAFAGLTTGLQHVEVLITYESTDFCKLIPRTEESCSETTKTECSYVYYHNNKTLMIYGTGSMKDYSQGGTPWNAKSSSISTIEIIGINKIGSNAFHSNKPVSTINIPESVKT